MLPKNKSLGFTLIELLVVISIISTLSSIVLSSLNDARSKARDAQRVSDLGELRKALMMYYDSNGSYPNAGVGVELSSAQTSWNTALNPLYVALVPTYISSLPVDPKNTPEDNIVYDDANNYAYYYTTFDIDSYKTNYDLVTRLENASNPNSCLKKDPTGGTFCRSHALWISEWDWTNGPVDGGSIAVDH